MQQATTYDDEEEAAVWPRPRHTAGKVRSTPMVDGRPADRSRRRSPAIALFAIAIALPAWLEGARTTRDGWVVFVNWILDRAHVPFAIAHATTWHWGVALGALILLGYGYSRVEIQHAPLRPPRDWRRSFFNWSAWSVDRAWQHWLVWIILIVTDVGTMYLGARQPADGDAAIFQQIAASARIAAVYAIILTFIPDQLLRHGWRSLKGG